MSAVKLLPYYTYEDYCNWEGRWELIDGIPFAMSPAPTPRHQWLVYNIAFEFKTALKKTKCKHCKMYDFLDVKIKEDTILQPDSLIICKPIYKKFLDFPAALVVEILSPATSLKDRYTKFSLYEKFVIKYYVIVDEEKNEIEIYHLENSKYILQKNPRDTPFNFLLDEDCTIEVLMKNIWE
ncbi:MAG: Uma2 family endonuclease [Bacteroidota bacterium]|nr:Uma2 family endonuclease [Bacteroidota bacterium]MDQ6890202.1 Uma2 family endonuclease [Bacteroidota bacterium]